MRKLIAMLLLLCLVLTGCGKDVSTWTFTADDLSIEIPEDFIAINGEGFAEDMDFIFGLDPIAINGMRQEKAIFEAYGLNWDLESFGKFVMNANNVSASLEQKDNICFFTYTSNGFSYVVTLWETAEAFWIVQGYCPTEDYNTVKNDIWEILSSVTV